MKGSLRFILASALAVTFLAISPAKASQSIAAVGSENWSVDAALPTRLDWSANALKVAKRAIALLETDLNQALDEMRQGGAIRVKVATANSLPKSLANLGLRFEILEYYGFDAKGNKRGNGFSLPRVQAAFANNLVKLNSNDCVFTKLTYSNLGKWFPVSCKVVIPKPDVFLKTQLAAQIHQGLGNYPDEVDYELSKLRYVLDHGVSFTRAGDYITFPEQPAMFGTDNKIWLGSKSRWFSFKITVNAKSRTATIEYLAPDYALITKSVFFDEDIRLVYF